MPSHAGVGVHLPAEASGAFVELDLMPPLGGDPSCLHAAGATADHGDETAAGRRGKIRHGRVRDAGVHRAGKGFSNGHAPAALVNGDAGADARDLAGSGAAREIGIGDQRTRHGDKVAIAV